MKTLYLDCGMGAAGDMLAGALLELLPEREAFLREINAALQGKAVVTAEADMKCGVSGTHVRVSINGDVEGEELHHHHRHTSIAEIREQIRAAALPEKVREDALAVFGLLAEAEAAVHGRPVENVHFHEVGSLDALADVLSVCLLVEKLRPDEILASPVHVGSGTVKCAHGELPVPAPATERLLRGIPWYAGDIACELCTPTGAALLKHFASDFCRTPLMKVTACGYGTGHRDLPRMNAVRALLGEREGGSERLAELSCNVDDMTGEELGFALEELIRAGALDVWTTAVGMKKSRPGILLTCLCREEQREQMRRLLFRHTTTLGVREQLCDRFPLERSFRTVELDGEQVWIKSSRGAGIEREKPEYEDLARIARQKGLSLREVRDSLLNRD